MKMLNAVVVSCGIVAAAATPAWCDLTDTQRVIVSITRFGKASRQVVSGNASPLTIKGIDNSVTLISIRPAADSGPVDLGPIIIEGGRSPNEPLSIMVSPEPASNAPSNPSNPANPSTFAALAGGIRDWGGITPASGFRGRIALDATIQGNLTGPIDADQITRLDLTTTDPARGGIHADVHARGTLGQVSIVSVVAEHIDDAAAIVADAGDIGTVTIGKNSGREGGLIHGRIAANSGAIGKVAVAGDISGDIVASAGIESILCSSFSGNVTSNSGGMGWLKFMQCSDGPFTGSVRCAGIGSRKQFDASPRGFLVFGRFRGSMLVDGDVTYDIYAADFAPDSKITVGGSLLARISSVGDSNAGSGRIGDVVLGGIGPLSDGYYDATPIGIFAKGPISSVVVRGRVGEGSGSIGQVRISSPSVSSIEFRNDAAVDLMGYGEVATIDVGRLVSTGRATWGSWNLGRVGTIDVLGDLFARVDVGRNDRSSLVRIGGTLGGLISTNGSEGFAGTCIINAAAQGGLWDRPFRIDRPGNEPLVLWPGPYEQTGTQLGGGSVGLVPFQLHRSDCVPEAAEGDTKVPLVLESTFRGLGPGRTIGTRFGVALRWYGPVSAPSDGGAGLQVFRVMQGGSKVDVTEHCHVSYERFEQKAPTRTVIVSGDSGFAFAPGEYHISTAGVSCALLLTDQATPVADADYVFEIGSDCDQNGELDSDQILRDPYYDRDTDGYIDLCRWFAGNYCLADFDINGGVDGHDIEAFDFFWELGHPIADINRDGGVDGADYQAFFELFALGC